VSDPPSTKIDDRPLTPVPPEEDTFPADDLARLEQRRWVLAHARFGGVGAEFGVFRGHFAAEIAEALRPSKLYLVDPWTLQGERFDWGDEPYIRTYTNDNRLTTEQALSDARLRVAPFRDELDIEFAEDYTVEFCSRLSTQLDFAYIDTSHDYGATLDELEAVSRVLAEDGVIMGDDWQPDPGHPHHGVMRGVNDFVRYRDFEIVAAGPAYQWCIRRTPSYSSSRIWLGEPFTAVPSRSVASDPTPAPSSTSAPSAWARRAKDLSRRLRRR
jgi:hypothetical protein